MANEVLGHKGHIKVMVRFLSVSHHIVGWNRYWDRRFASVPFSTDSRYNSKWGGQYWSQCW